VSAFHPRREPGDAKARDCEEHFMRRGNLELVDLLNYEIASLRSQRRLKDFFNNLLNSKVYIQNYES
jgi:hypothetical protein